MELLVLLVIVQKSVHDVLRPFVVSIPPAFDLKQEGVPDGRPESLVNRPMLLELPSHAHLDNYRGPDDPELTHAVLLGLLVIIEPFLGKVAHHHDRDVRLAQLLHSLVLQLLLQQLVLQVSDDVRLHDVERLELPVLQVDLLLLVGCLLSLLDLQVEEFLLRLV